jgi:hypothetical protein
LKVYLEAVPDAFGSKIDFAQLVKVDGKTEDDQRECYIGSEKREET